jgi:putative transposase
MFWARMLSYVTGTVDQELLLRNEYLAAENRILRAQFKGRLLLSDAEKATLAEIAQRLGRKGWLLTMSCFSFTWRVGG